MIGGEEEALGPGLFFKGRWRIWPGRTEAAKEITWEERGEAKGGGDRGGVLWEQ